MPKRTAPPPAPSIPEPDAHDLLRRHFEARFQPLDTPTPRHDEAEHDSQDSEWAGLSDDDDDTGSNADDSAQQSIQIVDHSAPAPQSSMSKRDLKAFMSSRPPDASPPPPTQPPSSTLPEDASSLLAQDLQLRRLLAESHLLAPRDTAKSFADGRTRRKATDMRLQALGAKVSILKQDKMPMNIRKGMAAAAGAREAKRRKEARENGIILERGPASKTTRERRPGGARSIDRPGVGRFRGAELRVSERDVRGIEGSRDAFGRKGKR